MIFFFLFHDFLQHHLHVSLFNISFLSHLFICPVNVSPCLFLYQTYPSFNHSFIHHSFIHLSIFSDLCHILSFHSRLFIHSFIYSSFSLFKPAHHILSLHFRLLFCFFLLKWLTVGLNYTRGLFLFQLPVVLFPTPVQITHRSK